ncbi:hypothetical protein C8Q75DRAFT_772768 [Abortiporus biennis]|nr:hypothetical protein C8Q75DRAFT_772768 [Abortiporus biennis]
MEETIANNTYPIIFYDLPASDDYALKAWSPNTWIVRLVLNVKRLPYRTEWVEFPDIQALYTKLGILPKSKKMDGSPWYTVPIIHDPSTNTTISEVFLIVQYLDTHYPSSTTATISTAINSPTVATVESPDSLSFIPIRLIPPKSRNLMLTFERAIRPEIWVPTYHLVQYDIFKSIPSERAKQYYRKDREEIMHPAKKLEDTILSPDERKSKLEQLQAGYEQVGKWMDVEGGEYVAGDHLTLADIYIVSIFMWMKALTGENDEAWKAVMCWEGGRWERYLDNLEREGFLKIY